MVLLGLTSSHKTMAEKTVTGLYTAEKRKTELPTNSKNINKLSIYKQQMEIQ
jgi:hypothetical protein